MKYILSSSNSTNTITLYSDFDEITFKYLIVFIQIRFDKLKSGYALLSTELADILIDVYNCKKSKAKYRSISIDIIELWESQCSAASIIECFGLFENGKLNHSLEKTLSKVKGKLQRR